MSSNAVASSSLAVEKSAGLTGGARSPAFAIVRGLLRRELTFLSTCGEIGISQISIHIRGSFMNYVDLITFSCDC